MSLNRHVKCFKILGDFVYNRPLSKFRQCSTRSVAFKFRPVVNLIDRNVWNVHCHVKPYSNDGKVTSPPAPEKRCPEVDLKKKSIEGGVTISDLELGSGAPAKGGKTVTVYYSGRLKATNKLFDAMTSGAGLTFRLGRGEVIDGWDIGLVGMKVGGKRIVTCPPKMAYGSKGFPPKIPPNSTLVFEVELKAVK